MPPKQPNSPVTNQTVEDLARCVSETADQIAVLREAIDELREQFTWAVQNAVTSMCPVLKRMAADPTASDWQERLVIVRGSTESNTRPFDSQQVQLILDRLRADAQNVVSRLTEMREHLDVQCSRTAPPRSPDGFQQMVSSTAPRTDRPATISAGDPVDFVLDGHEYFGEVLQVDEVAESVDICISPSMECVTVDLRLLQRVPDEDDTDQPRGESERASDTGAGIATTVSTSSDDRIPTSKPPVEGLSFEQDD